ncbi:MAG: bifunctional pyr operon transcriptional regulator/uracil phosphoribosyltransferase PyrR [Gammaproteobacteria bacterium]|nr:MAG: bifunctional pyr operon transcriptional regulator/uracil phosphoribosyltransferase PyrR [Gammaproteobacteria bacterium]
MTDDKLEIPALLSTLETNLKQQISIRKLKDPLMIGIHSGGVWIAEQLHKNLNIKEPLALMDISFYRDDFSQLGMHPKVKPSQLPAHMEGRDILLIDDVFYTGRTSRAALNEIFDYGRPNQVVLGVLIERDGRQVPLQPDCNGRKIILPKGQRIKLTGPSPLGIHIQSFATGSDE